MVDQAALVHAEISLLGYIGSEALRCDVRSAVVETIPSPHAGDTADGSVVWTHRTVAAGWGGGGPPLHPGLIVRAVYAVFTHKLQFRTRFVAQHYTSVVSSRSCLQRCFPVHVFNF